MLIRPQPIDSTTWTTSFVQESSSAENDLPPNRSSPGYEVFLSWSSGLLTCSNMPFLSVLKNKPKFWIEKRSILRLVWNDGMTCTLQTNVAWANSGDSIEPLLLIELCEGTANKAKIDFTNDKAAEEDAPHGQQDTVCLASSISRPVLLIGGRLVGRFLRLVPRNKLFTSVASCSTQCLLLTKQIQHPSVHAALGRGPSRNFIRCRKRHAEDRWEKASRTTLIILCLSQRCFTVGSNQSSQTTFPLVPSIELQMRYTGDCLRTVQLP